MAFRFAILKEIKNDAKTHLAEASGEFIEYRENIFLDKLLNEASRSCFKEEYGIKLRLQKEKLFSQKDLLEIIKSSFNIIIDEIKTETVRAK